MPLSNVFATTTTILDGTFVIEPKHQQSRTFDIPASATNVRLDGHVSVSTGIFPTSNNYSLHLASGSSYTLTLYNDALLAGDDKQVTATFTLSYD